MESTAFKTYVNVVAEFSSEGKLIPLQLIWTDGRRYSVDKVKSCQRAASRKAGGVGLRYTVMIHGQERYLYYEENYHWFVEAASPESPHG